jgi:hypothetical protein
MQSISLHQLLDEHVRGYVNRPVPFQAILKRSVLLTLISELAVILFFIFLRGSLLYTVRDGGFLVAGSEQINAVYRFVYSWLPWLTLLNLAMMFITLSILSYTLMMTLPAPTLLHQMTALHSAPTVLSWLSLGLIVIFLVIMLIINVLIWLIAIAIAGTIIAGFLSALDK